jgi:phosphohistidine phosphatase
MELYLIRHAIAQELGEKNDFTDEKRALTGEGRSKMREAARGLARLGVQVDLILTSPLMRAVETAQILAEPLGLKKSDIVETARLAPGASLDELLAEIKSLGAASIALVGHQPDLGDVVSRIVAGSGGLAIELRKGGACCVNVVETVPELRGDLVWLLIPKHLRALGKINREN